MNIFRMAVAFQVLLLCACDGRGADEKCLEALRENPVVYIGGFSGPGLLSLSTSKSQDGAIAAKIQLFDAENPKDKKVLFSLSGTGTCYDGVTKIQFSASSGENEQYKVLGGTLLGIFNTSISEDPFGKWTVSLFDKKQNSPFELNGFWKQHIADTIEISNEKAANSDE